MASLAVNGHPASLGANPAIARTIDNRDIPAPSAKEVRSVLAHNKKSTPGPHWRNILRNEGPKALAKAVREHQNALVTDTTWRDAHQSLLATRMRTADLLKAAEATNAAFSGTSDVFSMEVSVRVASPDTEARFSRFTHIVLSFSNRCGAVPPLTCRCDSSTNAPGTG